MVNTMKYGKYYMSFLKLYVLSKPPPLVLIQALSSLTFRITPNSVFINTPSGLKTIYNNKANVKKAV
ncbi:Uncharacterized protein HZ326_25456 [Fusarium oxysporum f. sp. albedinis]|nr:Uncharacterized protein HZ326_25456 [Fusarium oxysporum f. sp. albedinis]